MVVDNVCTVSVDLAVPGFGVNLTVDPEGCPVRLRVTAPPKPWDGVMVTV